MDGYEYLNARVRGRASRFLPREFFEQALSADGLNAVIDALLSSPYAAALKDGLSASRLVSSVESVLRRDITLCFAELRGMTPPGVLGLLDIQLGRWDLANILTIVRGKTTEADRERIMACMLPAGQLQEARLAELAAEPDAKSVAASLATGSYTFAHELRESINRISGPRELPGLELEMLRIYFCWALRMLAGRDPNRAIVLSMVRREIDLANIRAALDRVYYGEHGEKPEAVMPIPGGYLSDAFITDLGESPDLERAFGSLEQSWLAPAVEQGILAFGERRSRAVMERFLEAVLIRLGCALFRGDPLGIAVPLGYIWRKHGEYLNLRVLLRGKAHGRPRNSIREALVYA